MDDGRFKAGTVKFGDTPEGVEENVAAFLGADIKGFRVDKVLIEERWF